jgi:hypothetical protein
MSPLDLPIRAATETAIAHGITPDRCDILQDSSTLVLRLTESLVARVVQDVDGPRKGTQWFARENAVALHLTRLGAPIVPLHSALPPGPHEHLGYPVNFWQFVTSINAKPDPREIGRTLRQCHSLLQSFPDPLPQLAVLSESLAILKTREPFPKPTLQLLFHRLESAMRILNTAPGQPLHGDAHAGNLMNTTRGLLWTDWEDTFSGPVEWDIASIIWNAQILEQDHDTVRQILTSYHDSGGKIDPDLLHHSLVARAVVMTAWYPILYPNPNAERQAKLHRRLEWLQAAEP